ncbi:MAG: hypothetical protein IKR30_04930 [Bacteroidales bacterium]|nr:hypothetical protein [Bacteroidales bacterium]
MSEDLLNDLKERVESIHFDVSDEMFESIWAGTIRKHKQRKWFFAAITAAAASLAILFIILPVKNKDDQAIEMLGNTVDIEKDVLIGQNNETHYMASVSKEESFRQTNSTCVETDPSHTVVDGISKTIIDIITGAESQKNEADKNDCVKPEKNTQQQPNHSNPIMDFGLDESKSHHRKVQFAVAGTMPGMGNKAEYLLHSKQSVSSKDKEGPSIDEEPLPESALDPFISYNVPVSLRVLVSGKIIDCLFIEAGVSYSIHNNTSSIDIIDVQLHQQLHFVGIPMGVRYNLLNYGRTSAYIRAGGAVEKCVSGHINEDGGQNLCKIRIDPLFWSAEASLGAQVCIAGPLHLFAEAGGSYHFANSTGNLTYYGAHPLMFSIQAGARLELF